MCLLVCSIRSPLLKLLYVILFMGWPFRERQRLDDQWTLSLVHSQIRSRRDALLVIVGDLQWQQSRGQMEMGLGGPDDWWKGWWEDWWLIRRVTANDRTVGWRYQNSSQEQVCISVPPPTQKLLKLPIALFIPI